MSVTFEKFSELFIRELNSVVAEHFPEFKVAVEKINKCNVERVGVLLKHDSQDNEVIPVYYLDFLYDVFSSESGASEEDIPEFVNYFLGKYAEAALTMTAEVERVDLRDKEYILKHVFLFVCNFARNQAMIKNIPYTRVLDLCVGCRIFVNEDISNHAMQTGVVTEELLKVAGITEEELFKHAMINTEKLLGLTLKEPDFMTGMANSVLVTGRVGYYGSSALVCTEFLKRLYRKFNSDVLIVPINTDTLIVGSRTGSDLNKLYKALQMFNSAVTNKNISTTEVEYLSDNIYIYDGNELKVCK